ncbi:hypothetical protein D9M70_522150 [compost metagenome]
MQQRAGKGEGRMRASRQEDWDMGRHKAEDRLVADDRGCLTGIKLGSALARQHVADVAGLGPIDWRYRMNGAVGDRTIAQLRPNLIRQVTQTNPFMGRKKPVLFHGHSRTIFFRQFWTAFYQNDEEIPNFRFCTLSKSSFAIGQA